MKQTGEAATEFISRAKVTPEPAEPAQVKQTGEAATEFISHAKITPEPAQGTELLAKSEDARATQVTPLDPARNLPDKNLEAGKAAPAADKQEKKENKKEENKTVVPTTVKKPGTTPTPIFKNPVVIGVAALVMIIVLALVIYKITRRAETEDTTKIQQPTPTPTPIVPPQGMAYVPGGEFTMGRDNADSPYEKPAHKVTVTPFFIDITEVTNDQYQKFVDAGHPAPPIWQGNHFPEGANTLPVTDVTWEDANTFAQWAGDGRRLPTEEEWEFAARGTDGRIYPWGSEWVANASNTKTDENDQRQMVLVKQFPQGVSPFGLYDMSGNAWEWTSSEFKEYPGGPTFTAPDGYKNIKVIRGGAYDSTSKYATATSRGQLPATRNDWRQGAPVDYSKTGFRLAKDGPKPQ